MTKNQYMHRKNKKMQKNSVFIAVPRLKVTMRPPTRAKHNRISSLKRPLAPVLPEFFEKYFLHGNHATTQN